ncbi:hypothetical protein Tdes44962_MAKER08549 [Teratosphaeria destructans]|uniref:Uncharacterized protein n=1 Tax=Teratosphaeria destructans TaxID=418781 RepID=A0A9W7SWN1_9PEZI|nr:hypothetical protein Tdes44962_MAKER08549 [Teratosphaeria destructans]
MPLAYSTPVTPSQGCSARILDDSAGGEERHCLENMAGGCLDLFVPVDQCLDSGYRPEAQERL